MPSFQFWGSDKSKPSNKSHAPPDAPEESREAVIYREANERISRQHKQHNTIAVAYAVGSSVDDAIGFIRAVYGTDEGQLFWDTITSNIPVVMEALEKFSQVHPFLAVAYIPIQGIYNQVVLHRDNDKKRTLLFTKILDTMVRLLAKDDLRSTPDGKEKIASRLASICNTMKHDAEECFKVLQHQEKQGIVTKFLKASNWNKDLVNFAERFATTRQEFKFALHLQTAVNTEEIKSDVKERIVSQVWKSQGWDKTATTSKLVLGISHHLVERNRCSKRNGSKWKGRDNEASEKSLPLVDTWMVGYLENKRLYAIRQAFDPDLSGSVSIDDVNNFTQRRPQEWRFTSFPRWVAYWSIGWQIFATEYCLEIEELFRQLSDLTTQVQGESLKSVQDYIDITLPQVTALTSAIERFHCAEGQVELKDRFADYVKAQEVELKTQLEGIEFKISSEETVAQVLDGTRIEEAIFILLALVLRRHVAGMLSGREKGLNSNESRNDADVIVHIIDAVESRYVDLREQTQLSQQVTNVKLTFESMSFGLFKGYLTKNILAKPLPNGETCDKLDGAEEAPLARCPPPGADGKLWYSFILIDKDGSGQITANELQRALLNADWTPFHRSTVTILMTLFDADQSGTIDFHEFAGLWRFIENWKKVFEHFDKDHSGMIEKDELADVLQAKFGWTLSPMVLNQMQRTFASKTTAQTRNSLPGFSLDIFLRVIVIIQQLSEEFAILDSDHEDVIRIGHDQLVHIVLSLLLKLG
ncbi:Programmed cell death protein 6 [Mycena sanguinolenta]|uniref:Programmed cell death protein 6 n=1 Tax=Mycena sanguinolenta TaxID=230812 RepID=A0A8H6YIF7_9AGAR|nr:Programmed cell death protein 6 [Mycena sanguinolenta]